MWLFFRIVVKKCFVQFDLIYTCMKDLYVLSDTLYMYTANLFRWVLAKERTHKIYWGTADVSNTLMLVYVPSTNYLYLYTCKIRIKVVCLSLLRLVLRKVLVLTLELPRLSQWLGHYRSYIHIRSNLWEIVLSVMYMIHFRWENCTRRPFEAFVWARCGLMRTVT